MLEEEFVSLFEGLPLAFLYWQYFKEKQPLPSKALKFFGEGKATLKCYNAEACNLLSEIQVEVRGLEGSHKSRMTHSYSSKFSTLSLQSTTNIWFSCNFRGFCHVILAVGSCCCETPPSLPPQNMERSWQMDAYIHLYLLLTTPRPMVIWFGPYPFSISSGHSLIFIISLQRIFLPRHVVFFSFWMITLLTYFNFNSFLSLSVFEELVKRRK